MLAKPSEHFPFLAVAIAASEYDIVNEAFIGLLLPYISADRSEVDLMLRPIAEVLIWLGWVSYLFPERCFIPQVSPMWWQVRLRHRQGDLPVLI
jgi:hypothetical protein